jgi:histidine triad (HIT) family protein
MAGEKDPNCPFCKIVSGEIPSKKVYADDKLLAVLDINPAAKGHVILLPKAHFPILPMLPKDEMKHLARKAMALSRSMKSSMVAARNQIFIANGAVAGQQVSHLLIHIIPEGHPSLSVKGKAAFDPKSYGLLKRQVTDSMGNLLMSEGRMHRPGTQHLFETDNVVAKIPENPGSEGHVKIVQNSADVTQEAVEEMLMLSNLFASAGFDQLKAHGTNIIIDDKDDGFVAHVVPRFQGDGHNFNWAPRKADDAALDIVKGAISFGAIGLPDFPKMKPADKKEFSLDSIKPVSCDQDNFIARKLRMGQ